MRAAASAAVASRRSSGCGALRLNVTAASAAAERSALGKAARSPSPGVSAAARSARAMARFASTRANGWILSSEAGHSSEAARARTSAACVSPPALSSASPPHTRMAAAAGTATDGGEGGATSGASSGSTGSTTRGAASARLRRAVGRGRARSGSRTVGGADPRAAAHLRGERGGGARQSASAAPSTRGPAADRPGRGGDAPAPRGPCPRGSPAVRAARAARVDPRERNRVARTRRPRGGGARAAPRAVAVDEPRYERVAGGRAPRREQPKERRDRRERRSSSSRDDVVAAGRPASSGARPAGAGAARPPIAARGERVRQSRGRAPCASASSAVASGAEDGGVEAGGGGARGGGGGARGAQQPAAGRATRKPLRPQHGREYRRRELDPPSRRGGDQVGHVVVEPAVRVVDRERGRRSGAGSARLPRRCDVRRQLNVVSKIRTSSTAGPLGAAGCDRVERGLERGEPESRAHATPPPRTPEAAISAGGGRVDFSRGAAHASTRPTTRREDRNAAAALCASSAHRFASRAATAQEAPMESASRPSAMA